MRQLSDKFPRTVNEEFGTLILNARMICALDFIIIPFKSLHEVKKEVIDTWGFDRHLQKLPQKM